MSTTYCPRRPLFLAFQDLLSRRVVRDVRKTEKKPKALPWRGRKGR